ncbi:MAG: OmpA family protein, partial [Thermodesulfobacteriota bacterium]|nr:OmpA family protein [Thermodesulfobacteriota bacterium]
AFEPNSARLKKTSLLSLNVVSSMMRNNKDLSFHVITYCQNNTNLARQRALNIKKHITSRNPGVEPGRVILSWFGTGEVIQMDGKSWLEKESVNIITKNK